jgi:hypothetical protein
MTPAQEPSGPVQWKAAYSAAECKALTERNAFLQRCFGGHFADENYVGALKCMPYSRPERIKGIWVVGFESSAFHPGATSLQQISDGSDRIWFDTDYKTPEIVAAGQGAGTRAYLVELVGRRSLCEDIYGVRHLAA